MESVTNRILEDIGLRIWPPFFRDRLFIAALAIAGPVWVVMWLTVVPTFTLENRSIALIVFMTVVWYPVLEEILFRGAIQGSLVSKPFGQKKVIGLTGANWITSLVFALAHLWYQPALWAILIIFPSLLYGFFRDRHASIYPCIVLHAFYNGGFTAINLYAQLS
ncbi:JDVT-CTERM system glutamic-type intramembrane protease MrtJ [Kaarinaea lacus]